MNKTAEMNALRIAPCGMNCTLCIGFLRDKNTYLGCHVECDFKPEYCRKCIIKNYEHLKESESGFCYECPKFPCRRLKPLDKRYRTKYHMSMFDNLNMIKVQGLHEFLRKEDKKWTCPHCQARLSAHHDFVWNVM